MFVRTWLLHAPAAPVTEKRTLQLWACLNLRSTGSVCLGVQELYMVESNCTQAATVQPLEQLVRCPYSHIIMRHKFNNALTRQRRCEERHWMCPAEATWLCLDSQSHWLILCFLACRWHMCHPSAHVSRVQTLGRSSLSNDCDKAAPYCAFVCSWLCNTHCDQWKDS